MTDENLSEISHRSIPPSLGAVIGELEFRGDAVVSGAKIAEYAELAAGSPMAYGLIRRLVAARWLRPLGVQGYHEFIPGAAGPYSRNDDFDPLRAFLAIPALARSSRRAPHRYTTLLTASRCTSMSPYRAPVLSGRP